MRICILAFDGLEYDLVIRWRMKALMQEYYGKYNSPISPTFKKPHTPSAWASFITGKTIEEHGIDGWWTWGRFLDWLRFKPPLRYIKNKSKFLRKIGIRPKLHSIEEVHTIFNVIKPSIPLFIPSFTEPVHFHYELADAIRESINAYVKKVWEIHRYRKKIFLECLNKDWKLLMAWFDLADLLGHVFIKKNPIKLFKGYKELNDIASLARSKLANTAILIVSDHGMKPQPKGTGDHSRYGFWSLNVEPPFKPEKITDFYRLIIKIVNEL
ncbi:MAG: hypothetical protein DRJ38_08575 [Thermoprotei archaeon]|nr:MAG: hypothetical protein DRJ38_08575 [Thermoprotei archaeon]